MSEDIKTIFEIEKDTEEILESMTNSLIELAEIYTKDRGGHFAISVTKDENGDFSIDCFRDFVMYGYDEKEDVITNMMSASPDVFEASHVLSSQTFVNEYMQSVASEVDTDD